MFDPGRFFAIRSADIESMRPFLEPLLRKFETETALATAESVLDAAKHADCQLWSYHDGKTLCGVIATEIKSGPGLKICVVWVCVGLDVLDLVDGVMTEIESWAKSIGCTAMEIVGRPGWQKFVRGYRRSAVVLEKSLLEAH